MKMRLMVAMAVLSVIWSLAAYVNISFSKLDVAPFYDGCNKVWGHRGYFKNSGMNTLAGYLEAFELGAAGVEMDIFYDASDNRFYVSRDYGGDGGKGGTLTLEEVFLELGDRGYFWLDLKNLVDMNKKEAAAASRGMLALLDRYGLRQRVIVESKNAWNLAVFSKTGIHTSYWINVDRSDNGFLARLKVFRHKARFLYGRFSAVSMNYLNFTPYIQRSLGDIPVHIFTLNTRPEVDEFLHMKNVKVILSDEDLYTLSSCED